MLDDEQPVDETGQYVLDLGPLAYRQPDGREASAAGIHTSAATEDWYTAPEIVAKVRELYGGTIDLDPMSCEEANEVVGAKQIYTAADDGLVREWHGRILLNPPWSGSRRAVQKLAAEMSAGHASEAVLVLNANAMTTRWFAPLLMAPLCVPSYRIRHYAPSGRGGGSSPSSGTVMVYLGPEITAFARIFSGLGTILYCMRPASGEAIDRADAAEEVDW